MLASTVPPPALRRTLAAVALCALAALASCASGDKFAPACPQLGLLADAADLTRFRPQGQDVTDMVLDGRITSVKASCSPGEHGTVRSTVQVVLTVSRGPGATSRELVVPYFVGVTQDDRVLDEQDYNLAVAFPANTDTTSVMGQELTLDVPVTPTKSAAAYKIFVGFRLSPSELAYNRRRGAR